MARRIFTICLSILVCVIIFTSNSSFVAAKPDPNPIKVVIDPGHGGHDSGAIGINGLYEKDVNLDISLRLKDILLQKGYQVVLTRETDQTLYPYTTIIEKRADLQARVDVATNQAADFFVSIHANSYKPQSQGALILYYDPSNHDPNYVGAESMKKWSNESKKLAAVVLNSITSNMNSIDLGVIPSNVYVVRSGTVPSILIETAFLSNWEEANKLADPLFRQQMAESIASGIMNYLPPRFVDVRDHWAKIEIATLSYQGFIHGYTDGLFRPDQQMTRAEWIGLLDRVFGEEVVNETDSLDSAVSKFRDVPTHYWAYDAIIRAEQAGVMTGFLDGTFRPEQVLSREEMVMMLFRVLEKRAHSNNSPDQATPDAEETPEIEVEDNPDATVTVSTIEDTIEEKSMTSFIDIPEQHWSIDAIAALEEQGLIRGISDNLFGLGKAVTRAEAATILYRMTNELSLQ